MDARSRGALSPQLLLLLLAVAVPCAGCKSAPTNPFAEPPAAQQASGLTPSPTDPALQAEAANSPGMAAVEAESGQLRRLGAGVALAAVGLGQEVTQAAKDAAARVKLVAANTLAREKDQAQQIAAHAADTAKQVGQETAAEAQRQGIEALAAVKSDVAARRAAAAKLAAASASGVLAPESVTQLAKLIENENDPEVWKSSLAAVASSTSEDARRMAYTAMKNGSAEVRRAACDYLAAHGDPQNVQVLLTAINDPEAAVQMAAVRALGSVGKLDDPRPLVALTEARDKLLRVEAALALARLHVSEGAATLERLAVDSDDAIRAASARAMGAVTDRRYLPALVAMLGDQPPVQEAAMISLTRIAGSDVAAQTDGAPLSIDEKVRRWQHWYAEQGAVARTQAGT